MSNSELFKNVERSLYTFNFNNIIDICFDKVMKRDESNGIKQNPKLSDDEKILFDNCIDKYMLSFNIVKETSGEHLENLFNTKRS